MILLQKLEIAKLWHRRELKLKKKWQLFDNHFQLIIYLFRKIKIHIDYEMLQNYYLLI